MKFILRASPGFCHLCRQQDSESNQIWRFISPTLQKLSISKTAGSTDLKFKLAFREHTCIYQSSEWKTIFYIWYGCFVSWNTQMSLNAPLIFQNFILNVLALDWCIVTRYNNHPLSWKTRVTITFPLPWDIFVKVICPSNPNKVTVMVFLHNVFQETIDIPLLDHCFDTGSLAAAPTN